ncbi:hypothetical protein P3T76_011705 [Phytophthora citrophthora]|uniref:Uncharacterized protein n=1 Tax=Phytophthora citrophthora TaxID=4793 RepID=A0AAD9G8Y5_9STRA|nr:hypothetical protein P3T76_011705 [Phytophthora citrophthora]
MRRYKIFGCSGPKDVKKKDLSCVVVKVTEFVNHGVLVPPSRSPRGVCVRKMNEEAMKMASVSIALTVNLNALIDNYSLNYYNGLQLHCSEFRVKLQEGYFVQNGCFGRRDITCEKQSIWR